MQNDGQLETLKWFAFGSMVVDHLGRLVGVELPGWEVIGRLAFPLFAFVFAYNLARDDLHVWAGRAYWRLVRWGLLAFGVWASFGIVRSNVLLDFAAVLAAVAYVRGVWLGRAVWGSALCLGLAAVIWPEYGLAGVLHLGAVYLAVRSPSWMTAAGWVATLALLASVNGSAWALLSGAVLVVGLLLPGVPRVRGWFHVAYVGHLSILALVRAVF